MLNPKQSEFYEATKAQAIKALGAYPGGLQIGGGINADNAAEFIEAGASHVIVTSYVFRDGYIDYDRLKLLTQKVGKEHIVLDLSCKKYEAGYRIVTDRWQKFTDTALSEQTLDLLSRSCAEFLIHAADAEGKSNGIEEGAAKIAALSPIPCTYAGGISSFNDVDKLRDISGGRLDFTIGSALDIFGGGMSFEAAAEYGEEK